MNIDVLINSGCGVGAISAWIHANHLVALSCMFARQCGYVIASKATVPVFVLFIVHILSLL